MPLFFGTENGLVNRICITPGDSSSYVFSLPGRTGECFLFAKVIKKSNEEKLSALLVSKYMQPKPI